MAREPEEYASKIKYCPGIRETRCGSTNVTYKYLNNGKQEQPRYQCLDCRTWFTFGNHGRKKPGHYKEPQNQDPEELAGMRTECSWCGAVNQSRFKYYNNKNTSQPRFKCLGCENYFQMRFDGNQLVPRKSTLCKTKPATTKPAKTKPGKRAPPRPKGTTSADDGCDGVVNEAQVGQFSNTEDQTLYGAPESVPMEQCDGGQWFNGPEGVEASGSLYASEYAYEYGACAYEYEGVENAAQVGQFSNTEDQTLIYGASESVPMEQFDGGQNFCPQGMEASGSFYASQYECEYYGASAGQYSSAYEYNVVNGVQLPVLTAAEIPSHIPNYDTASPSECEEVNAEQVEQFYITDAVPVDQVDVGECPYTQEMAAAAEISYSVPNDDAMIPLEDFEEDLDLFGIVQDAISLWE